MMCSNAKCLKLYSLTNVVKKKVHSMLTMRSYLLLQSSCPL